MSRAFARHGVRPEQEVELSDGLWAITIDPQAALEEWLGKQLGGGAAGRLLGHSQAFQYFVAAAPGAKELITIAKVWELAQDQRWNRGNRVYDLVVVDAPASGHGIGMLTHAAHVRRDRPRRADPAPGLQGLRDARGRRAHRLRRRRAAGGDAGQRDDRARRAAAARGRAGAGRRGDERDVAGAASPRTTSRSCARPPRTGAVRAALSVHERVKAQRVHLRRLTGALDAPVTTLPVRVRVRARARALRGARERLRQLVVERLVQAPGERLQDRQLARRGVGSSAGISQLRPRAAASRSPRRSASATSSAARWGWASAASRASSSSRRSAIASACALGCGVSSASRASTRTRRRESAAGSASRAASSLLVSPPKRPASPSAASASASASSPASLAAAPNASGQCGWPARMRASPSSSHRPTSPSSASSACARKAAASS